MCGVHIAERVLGIRINIRGRAEGGAARNRPRVLRVDKGNELRRICFSVDLLLAFPILPPLASPSVTTPFSSNIKKLLSFIGRDPLECENRYLPNFPHIVPRDNRRHF